MVLLEEKNENFSVCYYDSSNILASKYRFDTKQLAIIFKDGSQYVYDEIPNFIFEKFKTAASQGKVFIEIIKGKYQTSKADGKVSLEQIIPLIEGLKNPKKD